MSACLVSEIVQKLIITQDVQWGFSSGMARRDTTKIPLLYVVAYHINES